MKLPRTAVSALVLSLSGFLALVAQEHYVGDAMVPTKNDRPTIGFGSTFHEDGRAVRMGDKTTPVRALIKAKAHIDKEEISFRKSLPEVMMYQTEYDLYMDWVYQYGTGAWWKSSMKRELLAGNYLGACEALLAYKFSGGYDCTTLINGKPNKRCWGVWTRQQERHSTCLAAQ
ncbi:MAG: lysozyme [Polaromonas sp.]|nr:lysozyme [Polaromonas sp.]